MWTALYWLSVARRPADVRRCRFIATVALPGVVAAPAAATVVPPRTEGPEPAVRLVVDDRGRVPAASFGSDGAPFRDAFGSPDARLLQTAVSTRRRSAITNHAPLLNNICLERQRPHDAVEFLSAPHHQEVRAHISLVT